MAPKFYVYGKKQVINGKLEYTKKCGQVILYL